MHMWNMSKWDTPDARRFWCYGGLAIAAFSPFSCSVRQWAWALSCFRTDIVCIFVSETRGLHYSRMDMRFGGLQKVYGRLPSLYEWPTRHLWPSLRPLCAADHKFYHHCFVSPSNWSEMKDLRYVIALFHVSLIARANIENITPVIIIVITSVIIMCNHCRRVYHLKTKSCIMYMSSPW